MNRAIIDIGTNSVRLLEARKSETGEWDVVRKEINSTRLGEGMTESASIADGSRHRTLKAIVCSDGKVGWIYGYPGIRDIYHA